MSEQAHESDREIPDDSEPPITDATEGKDKLWPDEAKILPDAYLEDSEKTA